MTDEREPCRIRWIGAVWRCETHDTYIEDGDVCPDADPNAARTDRPYTLAHIRFASDQLAYEADAMWRLVGADVLAAFEADPRATRSYPWHVRAQVRIDMALERARDWLHDRLFPHCPGSDW